MRRMLISLLAMGFALACRGQELPLVHRALLNRGFEMPSITDGAARGTRPAMWYYFASEEEFKSGISDFRKKTGLQGLLFKAQAEMNAYHGFAQRVSVTPGRHYAFSVYAMLNPSDILAGGAYGQISLEWQRADGTEVSRQHGPAWGSDLGTGRWEKYVVEADAPPEAAAVAVVIAFYTQGSGGSGSFFVDDCALVSRAAEEPGSP